MSIEFTKKYFFLCFAILLTNFSCDTQEELLPSHFHGYTIKKKLIGKEARQFVDRLHFQNVATIENEIGFYESEQSSTVIYISRYASGKQAQSDFKKMTEKISPQNSVFIGGTFLELNGVNVYRCFGMGQTHFVFVHQKQLFWISVETTTGKEFLRKYLDYLR